MLGGNIEDFWQVYYYLEPAPNLQEGQNYSFKKGTIPDWSKGSLVCKYWQVGADLRKKEGTC